jgi:beta propeller repeat protein
VEQRAPSVSGNIVVWYDERNVNADIYGYDLSTSTEFPICTDSSDQYTPSVSGSIVAWHDGRNSSYDIYGVRLEEPLSVEITSATPNHCAGTIDVTAEATGGTGPYSYAWDIDGDGYNDGRGASTTLDAGYDYSGTIRVQVTDDNSNQATDGDDSASTLSQLEIEITTFDINHCAGIIHAMASASGGDGSYTFDWDLDNDGVYDVLDAGTEVTLNPGYGSVDTAVVRVTDGNACTATESQAYSINDQLTVSLSAEYLNTGSATFTANCMGGDGSYTFDWDLDNDGSFDIIGSAYLVQTLVQPSSNPGLVTVHVYDGNGCACTDSVGYEIDTLWSPVSAQPLVTTALENANNMWQCIYPYFAECDDVDVLALMDEVQAHMRCAMSIANPIEASGELNRAMSLMNELAIRLACPCGV